MSDHRIVIRDAGPREDRLDCNMCNSAVTKVIEFHMGNTASIVRVCNAHLFELYLETRALVDS
jgi:hypothetical protein